MKIKAAVFLVAFIACLFLYNSFSGNQAEREKTVVTNVIDGDTIVISGGERVRLLGIDTPEKGELFYKESKERLEQLVENREVSLEKEGDNKDKYDRLLRYVFLNDTNINLLLVQEGFAICYFYQESKYQQDCKNLEENAMQNRIGRWQKA